MGSIDAGCCVFTGNSYKILTTTRMHRIAKRLAVIGVGSVSAYEIDKDFGYSIAARSLRTVGTGMYLLYQYKIVWTPEKASEVHARVARAITDTCIANEGLYVKIGQVLGSMAFALPSEFHKPLSELHDKAKTFEATTVRRIVEEDLGHIEFQWFEEQPIASASLAQVHRAMVDGQRVAVKVQKPNVGFQAEWDLRLYWIILSVLEYAFELPLKWTYDFTKQQLLGELDFRSEAYHSERARREFEESDTLRDKVFVPPVIASAKRVLITEWVDDAYKITDKASIAELGLNPSRAVEDAVATFAYQVFSIGHVHCDPHPGNLLIRQHPEKPRGEHQVVLIDHGLYVDLSDDLRRDYARLWVAMMPPADRSTLQEICHKWGIRDFEMYVNVTAFKHVTKSGKPRSAEDLLGEEAQKLTKVEAQLKLKARIKDILEDTSLFPRPLLFVGRSQNYIRSVNWSHGNPIDRVAVMMDFARHSLRDDDASSSTRNLYISVMHWLYRNTFAHLLFW